MFEAMSGGTLARKAGAFVIVAGMTPGLLFDPPPLVLVVAAAAALAAAFIVFGVSGGGGSGLAGNASSQSSSLPLLLLVRHLILALVSHHQTSHAVVIVVIILIFYISTGVVVVHISGISRPAVTGHLSIGSTGCDGCGDRDTAEGVEEAVFVASLFVGGCSLLLLLVVFEG
ncbi:hypothetical protein TYRP_006139 [Tyrophagus putrescentiae]|nr:hypothetical protein TYRP_006139 [Tyrophagus putrescentiae]